MQIVDTALDGNLNAPMPCKAKKIYLIRKFKLLKKHMHQIRFFKSLHKRTCFTIRGTVYEATDPPFW